MTPYLITAMKAYLHDTVPHHCLLMLPAVSMACQTGAHLYMELLVMWLNQFASGDSKEGSRL